MNRMMVGTPLDGSAVTFDSAERSLGTSSKEGRGVDF